MYATCIPLYNRIKPTSQPTKSQIDALILVSARWKRDNYNHLFEQPTQFYAVALALTLTCGGKIDQLNSILAWICVGTRSVHSLVHHHKSYNDAIWRVCSVVKHFGSYDWKTGHAYYEPSNRQLRAS